MHGSELDTEHALGPYLLPSHKQEITINACFEGLLQALNEICESLLSTQCSTLPMITRQTVGNRKPPESPEK